MNPIRYTYKIKDKGETPAFIDRKNWVKLNELFSAEIEKSKMIEQDDAQIITYMNDKGVALARLDTFHKRVEISYYLLISFSIIFLDDLYFTEIQTDIFTELAKLQFGESYHFKGIFHF